VILILLGAAGQETCSSSGSNLRHSGTLNTKVSESK
jgi:hypothetical protein